MTESSMTDGLMVVPDFSVLITGTGTEVGKTWLGCALATELRSRGINVAARKPAQSFDPKEVGGTDAELLAAATGAAPEEVCPPSRWYPVPLAPPMAVDHLGLPEIAVTDLIGELSWDPTAQIRLVELAGGLASPQAHDGDGLTFASHLAPSCVVLVSGSGLGVLNDVRLAARALAGWRTVVFMNHFDSDLELHCRNKGWLTGRDDLTVTTQVGELADMLLALAEPRAMLD